MGIRNSMLVIAALAAGCAADVAPGEDELPPPDVVVDDTHAPELNATQDTWSPAIERPEDLFVCSPWLSGNAGRHELTIDHDGRERRAIVHVPESYDPSVPTSLVLNFHGFISADWQQALLTRMHEAAEERGVIVVYPQGIDLSWNAGDCCGTAWSDSVDDVGFVRALLDRVESEHCVHPDRVFATGMSNGGFISHRLACEMSDRIAAIAPVAGVLGIEPLSCTPERAMPVLQFHGTSDGMVPYGGGTPLVPRLGFGLVFRSVAETIDHWAVINGCEDGEVEMFATGDAVCVERLGCEAPIRLCTIDGGGHTWPGGLPVPLLGHTSSDIDATDVMLDWFDANPMR